MLPEVIAIGECTIVDHDIAGKKSEPGRETWKIAENSHLIAMSYYFTTLLAL
jgi:hypothetical protein